MKFRLVLFVCLIALFTPARASQATARGLIVYCEPPATYRVAAEFVEFTKANHLSKLIRTDGRTEEIPTGGIFGIITYPEANSSTQDVESAIALIKALLPKTLEREAQAKLQTALTKWTNARAFALQKKVPASVMPAPPNPSRTFVVDGVKYSEVTLTGFADGVISITHSDGVAKLPAAKFTAQQIAALNATSMDVKIESVSTHPMNPVGTVTPNMRDRDVMPPTAALPLDTNAATSLPAGPKLIGKPMSGNFSCHMEVRDDGKVLIATEYYFFKPNGTITTIRIFSINGIVVPAQRHSGTYNLAKNGLTLYLASDNGKKFDSHLSVASDGTISNSDGLAWKRESEDIAADQLTEEQNRKFIQQLAIADGLDAGRKHFLAGHPVPTMEELDRLTDQKFAPANQSRQVATEQFKTLRKAFRLGFERGYREASEPAF